MIEYCIALFQKEREDRVYKQYISDCLRIITENTAQTVAWLSRGEAEVKYIGQSLSEILEPKPVETRTSEEIIAGIENKLQTMGGNTEK